MSGRIAGAVVCVLCQSRATMNPDGVCDRCQRGAPVPTQAAAPVEHPLAAVHTAPPPRENQLTLMWLGAPVTGFIVYGEPASQGSKNKGAHGQLYESAAKKVRPWRAVRPGRVPRGPARRVGAAHGRRRPRPRVHASTGPRGSRS
jgi:hypothetical protein